MPRYTVVSTPRADDQLSEIWTQATPSERAELTRVSHALDMDLRQDAELKGMPFSLPGYPTLRVWERYPLRVYFEVSEDDRVVRILQFVKLPPPP